MNTNTSKEIISSKIQGVELLRPWVVKISYSSKGKILELVYYKEKEGFSVRVNELKNGTWKKIKDKEEAIPGGKSSHINNEKSAFIKNIGLILNTYVGQKRATIPTKAEEARRLFQEEQQKKNTIKKGNTWKKIGKVAAIGLLTGGLIAGIVHTKKQNAKDKESDKNKQEIQIPDSTENIPPKTYFTVDSIKTYIQKDQVDALVSYESIADAVNAIEDENTKKELIACLRKGDVTKAQEMYGMKKNSQYTSNKATGKIDLNTLFRVSDEYFGLEKQEVLDHPGIPQDVKDVYQKFLKDEIYNNGANYIIISKTDFHLYLFTKDHVLLNRQLSLLGKNIGQEGERVPYEYYKTNLWTVYHGKKVNTNTPEWLFLVQQSKQLWSSYKVDGPKTSLIIVPINSKTQKIKNKERELNKYTLEIHPVYQPKGNEHQYEDRMKSAETDDNAVSHGCINAEKYGIVKDNVTIGKSVVYITDEPK